MTVSSHEYEATLVIGDDEYPLGIRRSGRIVLDEASAFHVQADLDLALPDETLATLLDPREQVRVRIDVEATFPTSTQSRSFDLSLRSRPIRHGRGGFASVSLASDEALLQSYRAGANDPHPLTLATSLRDVIDYVLDTVIPGAQLEASPANDADMTPYWSVTNLITNPSFEASTAGANASSGASSLQVTAPPVTPPLGSNALRWTAATGNSVVLLGGWDGVSATKTARVRPGAVMTASVYLLSSIARSALLEVAFRDENGGSSPVTFQSDAATTSTSEWTRYVVTFRVPPNAQYAYLIARTSGNTNGQFHYADAVMLHDGAYVSEPFTGSSSDSDYTYAWADAANASTSTRTPANITRDPEALVWRAGDSALEFLRPLVQAAGYRLVCDEQRKWTLRDEGYTAPGSVSIREGVNLISADDVIDIDRGGWFDARVTLYRWTDRDGIQQEVVDYYELNSPPFVVDQAVIDAPYPGPGRSEYAVRRAQGRGREVVVTAVADWRTQAEQPATFILDAAPIQTGQTSRVEFNLSNDRMTVSSRTVDTPPYAWSLIPEGEKWNDSPVGESWNEEVI